MEMAIDAAGFSAQRPTSSVRPWLEAVAERMSASGPACSPAWPSGHHRSGGRGDLGQVAGIRQLRLPESHSVSFAYLVYVSAWLKLLYPAAFWRRF